MAGNSLVVIAGLALATLLAAACDNPRSESLHDVIAPPDTIVAGLSDFNTEIYTIAPDGGRLTRITDTPGYQETQPMWTPDGRLAFVRTPLFIWHQNELIVAAPDGSDPVKVVGGMDIYLPTWSPDGSRIAFVDGSSWFYAAMGVDCARVGPELGQTPPRLFVADVTSRTAAPLVDLVSPDGCVILAQPQWSPDGTRIALASRGVYLVDAANGHLTELVPPTDAVAVAWSPDGQRLAVAAAPTSEGASSRILVVGADGRGLEEIARLDQSQVHTVAWSPMGDLIAFVGMEQSSGLADLYVVNLDGSDLRSLAQGENLGLAWSPDGRRLALGLSEPSSSTVHGNPINLYTVDLDTGTIARLTDTDAWDHSPVWAPDGSRIGFVSNRDAQSGVFAVHPDGSFTPLIPTHGEPPQTFLGPDRRVIAPAEASVQTDYGQYPLFQGALSPDGRRLATAVPTGEMQSEACGGDVQDVFTRNADGSDITNVTNTPDIHEMEVVWSPDSRLLALTSGAPPDCHFAPGRLEVMNADGSERHLLADFAPSRGQVDTPQWVAGGSALLFRVGFLGPKAQFGSPPARAELYTVNLDGSGGLRPVFEPASTDFQWLLSPDRERLAILDTRAPEGWRMLLGNVDGTDMREVASGDGELSQLQWWPGSWSPDSTRLAFSECRGDPCQAEAALFVVDVDGGAPRKLVDPFVPYSSPAWFPDGSRLAIETHPDPCRMGEGLPPGHLELVDAEGGEPERITDRCLVRWILGWPSQ